MGEAPEGNPPRTQNGDTLRSWCLPEVDKDGQMSGPSAWRHSSHTAALLRQGGARLPLRGLQMRMLGLGGSESKSKCKQLQFGSSTAKEELP